MGYTQTHSIFISYMFTYSCILLLCIGDVSRLKISVYFWNKCFLQSGLSSFCALDMFVVSKLRIWIYQESSSIPYEQIVANVVVCQSLQFEQTQKTQILNAHPMN